MGKPQVEPLDIDPKSIIVFCSVGNHFDEAVCMLKRLFPQARLTAIAPPWRTAQLSKSGLLDNVVAMTRNKLNVLRDLGQCMSLLAAIRAEKCDLFVTMYDSAALNLLHSVSKGRDHAVFDVRRNLYALKVGRCYLLKLLLGSVRRSVLGGATYALIRITLCSWGLFRRKT